MWIHMTRQVLFSLKNIRKEYFEMLSAPVVIGVLKVKIKQLQRRDFQLVCE